MRRDLDAIRERQVIKETAGELQGRMRWHPAQPEIAATVRRPSDLLAATEEERQRLLALRPGTSAGGF